MTATPVFVYGTLRAGEALSGLLPDEPTRYHATAAGALHYSPSTRGYPVFVPENVEGEPMGMVDGEVVWLNLDDGDVAYVVIMELSSGYSAQWMPVYISGEADAYIDALVFTWNPEDGLGEHIESGDWTLRNTDKRAHYCIECGEEYLNADRAIECEWRHDQDREDERELAHALSKEDR